MSGLRVLFAGSRNCRNRLIVRDALLDVLATFATVGTPVLVHGAQRSVDQKTGEYFGADYLAEREWLAIGETVSGGLSVEKYPADWRKHGRAAGPIRNSGMVALGATVCVTVAEAGSRGTFDCADKARAAGIPVRDYGVSTRTEDRP